MTTRETPSPSWRASEYVPELLDSGADGATTTFGPAGEVGSVASAARGTSAAGAVGGDGRADPAPDAVPFDSDVSVTGGRTLVAVAAGDDGDPFWVSAPGSRYMSSTSL